MKSIIDTCRIKRPGARWLVALALLASAPALRADIAVIVHPGNGLAHLEGEDIRRIFMGRMRMYPDSTLAVEAVDLPEENPLFVEFYQTVAGVTPTKLKRQRASYLFSGKGRLPTVIDTVEAVKAKVSGNPEAIGYIPFDRVDASVKAIAVIKQ